MNNVRPRVWRVATIFLLWTACGGGQKPDSSHAQEERRAAEGEQRIKELERRLDSLEARGVVASELVTRVESHEARLAAVEQRQGEAPSPGTRGGRAEVDPTAVYSVPVDGNPSVGPKHAYVTVVEAIEFACPFCERVRPTLDQLRKDYGEDLRIVYKHFVVHPQVAMLPGQAACAAHRQGKYRQMHDLIWDEGFNANRNLSRENLLRMARKLKLKMKKFESDLDGDCVEEVKRDQEQLTRVGVQGTPNFFINGRMLSGAQPIETFKKLIDEELAKARASGIAKKEYYQHVVDTGLKSI